MQALYSAEVDQVSGGISDSEAREAVFQTRLEGMIQDRADGHPFIHHDLALVCATVAAAALLRTAVYVGEYVLDSAIYAINAVRNMEFISCDEKGNCCCPSGG